MTAEQSLPASTFAHEVLALLAQGDLTLSAFADSIDVTPAWLERVVTGEITELPLLTVLGICRKLRHLPQAPAPARRHLGWRDRRQSVRRLPR